MLGRIDTGDRAAIGPCGDPWVYSSHAGSLAGSSDSEALRLNAKFLRNGIVMLVLVAGTVALLYTWVQSSTPSPSRSATSSSSPTSRPGKVQTASSRTASRCARHPQARTAPDLHRPRPEPDLHQRRGRHGRGRAARRRHARPAVYQRKPDPGHVVDRAAADGPAAAARDRRLHLLHDAPGPGHQQPGHVVRQEPRADVPRQQDRGDVRRRGRRRRGQDGAPGGRGVPQVPREVQLARRAHPARRAARRARPAPARR